ncbi:hypothetical protein AB1L42_15695 [Thalassoglobus sp. JC818]|uniref:hypothetical protein n=1 Tax=Thalassoglobus sp. JC818 TaxID=3232136 RepID=UPI00345808C9
MSGDSQILLALSFIALLVVSPSSPVQGQEIGTEPVAIVGQPSQPESVPPESSSGESPLYKAISELLDAGFQKGPVEASTLDAIYNRQRNELGGESSLLDYAYSIVLRKNFQAAEGTSKLQEAASATEPVLLAREELIRQLIEKNKYSSAITELEQLSKIIRSIPKENPQFAQAAKSAYWIGIAIDFLQNSLGNDSISAEAKQAEARLNENLKDRYSLYFRSGRGDAALTRRSLLAAIEKTKSAIVETQTEELEKAKEESEQIAQQQVELEEKLNEFRDVATDDVADLDAKIAALQEQYSASLEAEDSIQTNLVLVQNVITELRIKIDILSTEIAELVNANSGQRITFLVRRIITTKRIQRTALEEQLWAAERDLLVISNSYATLMQSRSELTAVGRRMIQRRQELAGKYQRQSAGARAELEKLERLQAQIERSEENAKEDVNSNRRVKSASRRVREFSSYYDGSLAAERSRLIQSLKQ